MENWNLSNMLNLEDRIYLNFYGKPYCQYDAATDNYLIKFADIVKHWFDFTEDFRQLLYKTLKKYRRNYALTYEDTFARFCKWFNTSIGEDIVLKSLQATDPTYHYYDTAAGYFRIGYDPNCNLRQMPDFINADGHTIELKEVKHFDDVFHICYRCQTIEQVKKDLFHGADEVYAIDEYHTRFVKIDLSTIRIYSHPDWSYDIVTARMQEVNQ